MRAPALVLAAVLAAPAALAQTASPAPASRGALLYATHCGACHTAQMHWRDGRTVADWPGLVDEVRRWQHTIGLGWGDEDVTEVARHLNETVYRFPVRRGALVGALPAR